MADTKFTRDRYIRELKRLMDENPDIVKAIQKDHPDRFYAAIQDHFETYPELGKAKWRSRKGRNKITGSMPTKEDPGEYFRISKVGDGFTFKSESSRAAHRKKYVSKRAEQIELNREKYLGAVRNKAGKNFDDLVGPNNTFEMGGKTYNRKEYIDYEVYLAGKQNKLTDVELKKPQEFYPGQSTIGHSTSVYSPEAVEAPHAKYPESKLQNQADQGAEYAGKTERIKQAGMATDVDTAADMQLGTGERVNDPTSGEVRNRIMRGEPEDLVKKQDLLRKRLNTVGDLYIDDITENSKVFSPKINRAKLIKLGVAGIVLPGAGSVANIAEASERAKIAAQTNNRLDVFQSWLSNAELTTGVIPIGEPVSTLFGALNLGIDLARYGTQPTDTSSRQRYRHGTNPPTLPIADISTDSRQPHRHGNR